MNKLVKAKQFIAGFDHERVNVHLRVLAMIVQEDESRIPGLEEATIRGSNWLEDDVIANVVLE